MSEQVVATINGIKPTKTVSGWPGKIRALYLRSEAFRGYTLLSPTLLVMLFIMCVPFALMVGDFVVEEV